MIKQREGSGVHEQEGQAWYKQFWGWFVFTPLFVVIIASLFFVSTAFKHSDDVVIDNYYQEGRLINQRFELDKKALALGLEGELRFDRETGEVILQLTGLEALPKILKLNLSHPASQKYDRELFLTELAKNYYRGELERKIEHRWYVRIQPNFVNPNFVNPNSANPNPAKPNEIPESLENSAGWRLNGKVDFSQSDTVTFGR